MKSWTKIHKGQITVSKTSTERGLAPVSGIIFVCVSPMPTLQAVSADCLGRAETEGVKNVAA